MLLVQKGITAIPFDDKTVDVKCKQKITSLLANI